MPKDKQEPDTRNVDFTGKTDFTRNSDYRASYRPPTTP